MIPEAVAAAEKAVRKEMESRTYDRHAHDAEVFAEGVADIARAALEAAAPYLRAQALMDAADEWSDWDALQAPEAWLRARAVTEREGL